MSEQKKLVETFYQAFQNKQHELMAQCYHADVKFRDAAFELEGKAVSAMWHMLCERGKDMSLTYTVAEAGEQVTAHWEATYTFSQTGRKVHNVIDADFAFADGKIIRHNDAFNFWRWSRQALGLPGLVLGWSPMLQQKVRSGAAVNLKKFIAEHPEYQG